MWRWFIQKRLRARRADSAPIERTQVDAAGYILFSVFARYGDGAIAFKVINEFINAHPHKRYALITTRQALPYARAIVSAPIQFYAVNKRRNPIHMARLVATLRRQPPDLAFNPWSHGEDSEYFASFAKRFFLYRDFANFTREVNLYKRARDYLMLPAPAARTPRLVIKKAQHIVIAPFSTDIRKSLDANDLALLLEKVRVRFSPQRITLAAFAEELRHIKYVDVEHFVFNKNAASSDAFLALLRQADLFIGVDAGPLHVAGALGIPSIGLFGPTAPETILDTGSGILPLRTDTLDGVFCDVLECRDPVCLHQMTAKLNLDTGVPVDFRKKLLLEKNVCRAVIQVVRITSS